MAAERAEDKQNDAFAALAASKTPPSPRVTKDMVTAGLLAQIEVEQRYDPAATPLEDLPAHFLRIKLEKMRASIEAALSVDGWETERRDDVHDGFRLHRKPKYEMRLVGPWTPIEKGDGDEMERRAEEAGADD